MKIDTKERYIEVNRHRKESTTVRCPIKKKRRSRREQKWQIKKRKS